MEPTQRANITKLSYDQLKLCEELSAPNVPEKLQIIIGIDF